MNMSRKTLMKLRNKRPVRFFNRRDKIFIQFQLNRESKRIFWEKFVSSDKINWVKQCSYYNLKGINKFIINNKNGVL